MRLADGILEVWQKTPSENVVLFVFAVFVVHVIWLAIVLVECIVISWLLRAIELVDGWGESSAR